MRHFLLHKVQYMAVTQGEMSDSQNIFSFSYFEYLCEKNYFQKIILNISVWYFVKNILNTEVFKIFNDILFWILKNIFKITCTEYFEYLDIQSFQLYLFLILRSQSILSQIIWISKNIFEIICTEYFEYLDNQSIQQNLFLIPKKSKYSFSNNLNI